jgi:FtsH-binding integral membrane protein
MNERTYAQDMGTPVAALQADARAAFLTRTYIHLAVAIFAFVALEVMLFSTGLAEPIAKAMLSTSWLIPLGLFMVVSWIASRVTFAAKSKAAQYAALAAFVVAEAIIFVPLLLMAQYYSAAEDGSGGVIQSAAIVTLLGFTGLTLVALLSGKDFSFLGGLLKWGFIVAVVLIVGGSIFGFHLGTFFSVGMVALAGAAILYDTSNILRRYPEDRYVAASLQLFASVALMFWYVLQLFMSRD